MKRKCQGCNKLFERDLMFKITRSNNEIFLNPPSNIVGRSVYVCKNEVCVKSVIKKKRISRGLKISADVSEVESLLIHNLPF